MIDAALITRCRPQSPAETCDIPTSILIHSIAFFPGPISRCVHCSSGVQCSSGLVHTIVMVYTVVVVYNIVVVYTVLLGYNIVALSFVRLVHFLDTPIADGDEEEEGRQHLWKVVAGIVRDLHSAGRVPHVHVPCCWCKFPCWRLVSQY